MPLTCSVWVSVARVTLNRPEVRNAFDDALIARLKDVFQDVEIAPARNRFKEIAANKRTAISQPFLLKFGFGLLNRFWQVKQNPPAARSHLEDSTEQFAGSAAHINDNVEL